MPGSVRRISEQLSLADFHSMITGRGRYPPDVQGPRPLIPPPDFGTDIGREQK